MNYERCSGCEGDLRDACEAARVAIKYVVKYEELGGEAKALNLANLLADSGCEYQEQTIVAQSIN